MSLEDLLARCPRCRVTVLLTVGEASYHSYQLFEAVPWSPLDEPSPQGLSAAAVRKWRAELPYRRAAVYVDFERGTWQLAMIRASERLRPQPLFVVHVCEEERRWLSAQGIGDLVETTSGVVPDQQPLARAAAHDGRRQWNPRIRARAAGGL